MPTRTTSPPDSNASEATHRGSRPPAPERGDIPLVHGERVLPQTPHQDADISDTVVTEQRTPRHQWRFATNASLTPRD
jgi:hypothetical protein